MISIKFNKKMIKSSSNSPFLALLQKEIVMAYKPLNNSHEDSLIIHNYNLEDKKRLYFNNSTSFGIYNFFQNKAQDQLLLHCDAEDNEVWLIHVDLKKEMITHIKTIPAGEEIIFSHCYWWDENCFFLSDYKGNFFSVSIPKKSICATKKSAVISSLPFFVDFYHASFGAIKIYPFTYRYIKTDEQIIELYDFITNTRIAVPNFCPSAYDYAYKDGFFLAINEHYIVITSAKTNDYVKIKPPKSYSFCKGLFIAQNEFIVLACHGLSNALFLYAFNET